MGIHFCAPSYVIAYAWPQLKLLFVCQINSLYFLNWNVPIFSNIALGLVPNKINSAELGRLFKIFNIFSFEFSSRHISSSNIKSCA